MDLRSHRTQLVLTALAASASTAALFSIYSEWDRRRRRQHLQQDVLRSLNAGPLPEAMQAEKAAAAARPDLDENAEVLPRPLRTDIQYDEELIREQLARNYAFFGETGMERVRRGRVVIVGCGGVGSWAAVMLARSGIAKLRLVDFDYVTLSSLNRHATATLADVGTPKVKCVEKAIHSFARWIEIDSRVDIWRKDEGGALLEDVDWVIDCIDNIDTKVDLLAYCHKNNLKVFSSMGAGAKRDPTRIQIADISTTIYDPLARSVRRRLRLQGINGGIPVVYSTEVPGEVALLPLPDEEFAKGKVKDLSAFDDFRVRVLPVLGPLPAIFGLHAATYVLCELSGKPIENPLPVKNRRKLYERLLRDLIVREARIAGDPERAGKLPIDEEDVALIFEDIHGGRSVLPPHHIPGRPALTRWNPDRGVFADNIVVMEVADADKHARACFGVNLDAQKAKSKFVMANEDVSTPDEMPMRRSPADVWGEEAQSVFERRSKEIERCRLAGVP